MDDVPALAPAQPPGAPPSWPVPPGGWDAHAHVFGPPDDYPLAPSRRYLPPTQTLEQYLATLDRLGITHGVLVQPSVYGLDNSCLLDALDRAPDRLRGVIAADLTRGPADELAALTARGVRGVRVAWTPALARSGLAEQAAVLADLGWHLDIRVEEADHLLTLGPQLAELTIPVMVESMGSPAADDPDAAGFRLMLELITEPHIHAKLSHPYQIDRTGPPYRGTVRFARALVEAAPGKLVWGSDWPHPLIGGGVVPRDNALLDLLLEWAGDPTLARQVLCDNPARFYGYQVEGGAVV